MKSATPLALLRRIALERLPLIVTDDGDFKAISDLVRTGLLEATMQVVLDRWGGGPQTGIVIREITRLSKMALQHKDLGPVETGTETKGTLPGPERAPGPRSNFQLRPVAAGHARSAKGKDRPEADLPGATKRTFAADMGKAASGRCS